jgi:hypothetical protein
MFPAFYETDPFRAGGENIRLARIGRLLPLAEKASVGRAPGRRGITPRLVFYETNPTVGCSVWRRCGPVGEALGAGFIGGKLSIRLLSRAGGGERFFDDAATTQTPGDAADFVDQVFSRMPTGSNSA